MKPIHLPTPTTSSIGRTHRASTAATIPPIAAKVPAAILPAPAVWTSEVVDAGADPVEEGLVAVVSVVWPAVVLALPVVDKLPLPPVETRVAELAAEEVLVVIVTATELDELVETDETLVGVGLAVLEIRVDVELLVLSPAMWNGLEYW